MRSEGRRGRWDHGTIYTRTAPAMAPYIRIQIRSWQYIYAYSIESRLARDPNRHASQEAPSEQASFFFPILRVLVNLVMSDSG